MLTRGEVHREINEKVPQFPILATVVECGADRLELLCSVEANMLLKGWSPQREAENFI